jgi:hypothetical protein
MVDPATVSHELRPRYRENDIHDDMMFLLVSKTPFGVPVEPLVYMMQNKSSSVGFAPSSEGDLGEAAPNAFSSVKVIQRPPRALNVELIDSTALCIGSTQSTIHQPAKHDIDLPDRPSLLRHTPPT